jgi:hypothetical protein
MKIIRVFPRKTHATPDDENVRSGKKTRVPCLIDEADEIHISVSFTWDIPYAEWIAKQWKYVAPVKIGGPAFGKQSDDFIPGLYLKQGYIITSRGCPNKCWFCSVPKREGNIRELQIKDGWNILDDNLLACSDNHIKSVFEMLSRQNRPIEFTGGIEAARLKLWHAEEMKKLRIGQIFFAYDTDEDLEPLWEAAHILREVGFTNAGHSLRCFVLCGFKGDTFEKAESRMFETMYSGFTPMAMLWRDKDGKRDPDWMKFQKLWARPAIIYARVKQKAEEMYSNGRK